MNTSRPPRISIVDGNEISRLGIEAILRKQDSNVQVAGSYADLAEAEQAMQNYSVDVLLLDELSGSQTDLARAVQRLMHQHPGLRVIVLSSQLNFEYIHALFNMGALGFVYKERSMHRKLLSAVESVIHNEAYISPAASILPYAEHHRVMPPLTPRELEVARLMQSGFNTVECAGELNISPRMVYRAQRRLRHVLGVRTNAQIVEAAVQHQYIKPMSAEAI